MTRLTRAALALALGLLLVSSSLAQRTQDLDDDDDDDDDDEPETRPPPRKTAAKPAVTVDDDDDHDDELEDEDEKDASYDPEEFEGFKPKQAEAKKPASETRATEAEKKKPKTWLDFIPEICAVMFIICYVINFFVGRSRNTNLATIWYLGAMQEMEKQFAFLGCAEESAPQLLRDGFDAFKFYASGRINCESVEVDLQLVSRQDMFSQAIHLMSPAYDLCLMEFALPDECLDQLVFAIVSKRDERALRTAAPDLDKLARRVPISGLNDSLVCLSDCPSAAETLLVPKVLESLDALAPYIKLLRISDRSNGLKVVRKSLTLCYYLTPRQRRPVSYEDRVTAVTNLTRLALGYLDKVASLRLSSRDKEKAKALRVQIEMDEFRQTAKTREEEAQRRKLEKQLKEKERLEALSPEQQAKVEEKNARREAKKAASKFKVMKMK